MVALAKWDSDCFVNQPSDGFFHGYSHNPPIFATFPRDRIPLGEPAGFSGRGGSHWMLKHFHPPSLELERCLTEEKICGRFALEGFFHFDRGGFDGGLPGRKVLKTLGLMGEDDSSRIVDNGA